MWVDTFFYYIENIKQGTSAARKMNYESHDSPMRFWESLNEEFRRNLIAIHLFNEIDCKYYQSTRKLRFNISAIEATRASIQFAYGFYASSAGKALIFERLVPFQRLILLQLIVILRIQFSSKSSPRTKLSQFLKFVQQKGAVYLDRETVLAFEYFKDSGSVPLFKKVNRGGAKKRLMSTISNMAWDMTAPRFVEQMLTARLQGDYTIPFFLSFDMALCRAIKAFPIKAAIIDVRSESVLSLPEIDTFEYFRREGCEEIVRKFFSPESKNERALRESVEPEVIMSRIRTEFRELWRLLRRP